MLQPQLLFTTGRPAADRTLRSIVGLSELLLPGRTRAYYLHGSFRDGIVLPTSDIDVVVVLRPGVPEHEAEGLRRVLALFGSAAIVQSDVLVVREDELRAAGATWLRDAATLLFGENVAATFRSLPQSEYTRRTMHAAFNNLARWYPQAAPLSYPLAPPDPADPWLGYASRPVRLPDGSEQLGTVGLVSNMSWTALALTMFHGAPYLKAKGEAVARLYRESVADEWSPFLDDLFRRCQMDWHYLIPMGVADRDTLRRLCERAVGFFNHFLAAYRSFLLAELADGMPARQFAVRRLRELLFPDPVVREAVATLVTGDGSLAAEARATLNCIDTARTGQKPCP